MARHWRLDAAFATRWQHFPTRQGTLLLVSVILLICTSCKQGDYFFFYLVEEQPKQAEGTNRLEYFKEDKFDAQKIVADIWQNTVIRAITERAVELPTVSAALAADPDAAGKQYGHREEGGEYPWNFIVKGAARVVAINTKTRKGTLSIDLPSYDGKPDATIWIGPIITSYSIRDAIKEISFTTGAVGASGTKYTFDTQVQFAELSNAINARGNQNTLAALEPVMCYKLTEESFQSLKEDQIPEVVLTKLSSLKDQPCTNKDAFWNAIKQQAGADVEQYQAALLKAADTSDSAKGREVRFYGAFTHQKSGEIIITPVQLEIGAEGGQS
jgi:predicted lipoprotein